MNPLATANANQITKGGVKGDWVIRANGQEGEELGRFPGNLTDAVVWDIIHFSRKYELLAFNAGINFQKDKDNAYLMSKIAALEMERDAILAHNATLAYTVERLTNGENHGNGSPD